MTRMKEKAVEVIRRMPEDKMAYVINILQNLDEMSIDKDSDKQRAKAALTDILNILTENADITTSTEKRNCSSGNGI